MFLGRFGLIVGLKALRGDLRCVRAAPQERTLSFKSNPFVQPAVLGNTGMGSKWPNALPWGLGLATLRAKRLEHGAVGLGAQLPVEASISIARYGCEVTSRWAAAIPSGTHAADGNLLGIHPQVPDDGCMHVIQFFAHFQDGLQRAFDRLIRSHSTLTVSGEVHADKSDPSPQQTEGDRDRSLC